MEEIIKDVDTVGVTEKLAMSPLRSSEKVDALALALAKAQGDMAHPQKNKVAKVGTYSYNYADLADCIDAVRAPFAKNEIAMVQIAFNPTPTTVGIVTRLMHSSGQWIEGTLFMPTIDARPQTIGSAITYGRRYALSPMAGIASDDDDDGNQAQGQTATTANRVRQQSGPQGTDNKQQVRPTVDQLSDRAVRMLDRFKTVDVTRDDIERKMGKNVTTFGDAEYRALKNMFDKLAKASGDEVTTKAEQAFG